MLRYQDEWVTLFEADARKLDFIPDESVALVVTSPPYNVGVKYDTWKDDLPFDEYWQFTREWLAECYRVLKVGGRIAVNVPNIGNNPEQPKGNGIIILLPDMVKSIVSVGFKIREMLVWNKNNRELGTDWGSWLSPSNPSARSVHEHIVVAHKEQMALSWSGVSDLEKEEFLELSRSVWDFRSEWNRTHPAPFPPELPRRLVKLYTYLGDLVLDPFIGSGTTARVCKDNRRHCIGVDVSAKYLRQAADRCAQYVLDMPTVSTMSYAQD